MSPNPIAIDPDASTPTVVSEEVTILDPSVVPLNTVVPAMSYPLPLATDRPDEDLKGPPSAPLIWNVTSFDASEPSINSPAFWLESRELPFPSSSLIANTLAAVDDDAPIVVKSPCTVRLPAILTSAVSVIVSAVVTVESLFILNIIDLSTYYSKQKGLKIIPKN